MQVVGRKVVLYVTEDLIFDAYLSELFMGEYFSVFSLNLPSRIVVHKSWVMDDQVFLPESMAKWIFKQMNDDNFFSEDVYHA